VAYMVAFQHAAFHAIPVSDGFHGDRDFNTRAISSWKSAYAFYDRRSEGIELNLAPLLIG